MTTDDLVAGRSAAQPVLDRILGGLARAGIDRGALRAEDLKPIDEFHTGGLGATDALLRQLCVVPGSRILDIGCGIGGTERHVAKHFGAHALGIDRCEAYVAAARALTEAVGLGRLARFEVGRVTELDLPPESFDHALMLHGGMNVADKAAIFRATARALRRGGRFAVFDVMATADAAALTYPLPWSDCAETCFVAAPETYRNAAATAGFRLVAERDRADFAREFFRSSRARAERDGPPVLGLHLLIGETAPERIRNYAAAVEAGHVAPRELIFEKT